MLTGLQKFKCQQWSSFWCFEACLQVIQKLSCEIFNYHLSSKTNRNEKVGAQSCYKAVFHMWNLWVVLVRLILGAFTDKQINVLSLKSVTHHCLGSLWPPNVISKSPKGQPEFMLQQYLVAVMPHCIRYFRICIPNTLLVDHNDSSSNVLTKTE